MDDLLRIKLSRLMENKEHCDSLNRTPFLSVLGLHRKFKKSLAFQKVYRPGHHIAEENHTCSLT